ncbi:hypothetical protein N0V82_001514 [Gnomoniopsis sp. IMI 355080]|nr:hypothetical protein N0V82_001514 [Gnomoniopsis sp. IMI 355080]
MTHSGPDAATAAALKREPIILRGFDERRQLDIKFRTVPYGAVWLRRTYTNEGHPHITQRARNNESRLQKVRYGNNVTLLLQACYALRRFSPSPSFWPAIAQGFGASADTVRNMVELLVDARERHSRNFPTCEAPSGANIAADTWLAFVAAIRRDRGTTWSNENSPCSSSEVFASAQDFFKSAQGRLVDKANVLPKQIEHLQYSPPDSRKRFASPEPPGRPPSPKRRSSSGCFDRSESLSARLSQPLTPLSTNNQIKGQVRQDYQTPVSASDRPSWVKSSTQGSPDDATELFQKIRGTASENETGLPVNHCTDSKPKHALSDGSSDIENHKLRERVATLEKELSDMKSRLSNDQHHRNLVKKILFDHGLIPSNGLPSTLDPAVKSLQDRVASLESEIAGKAAHDNEEMEGVKDSIQITKEHVVMLNDNLVKRGEPASVQDRDISPISHALANVQGRLASLEDKLVHGTTGMQTELASLEPRLPTVASQSQDPSVPGAEKSSDMATNLKDRVSEPGAKEHGQIDSLGMLDKISRLENGVNSISNRITKIESEPGEGEYVRELESRVAVIEHRQDRDQEKYATKSIVETNLEHLESRLTRERNITAEQLRNIHQRLMATEVQSSRLLETVDNSRVLKSTSPSHHVQRDMEEMLKTVNSLRSATSVSEMIDKRDQVLRTDIEKLRRNLDDISTRINSLPDLAYISDKIFRLEQGMRAELKRHRDNTSALTDGSRKDLETLQLQVKGLNKLWNQATAGVVKEDSLLALKLEVNALKSEVANQSKKFDESDQGPNIAVLERQIADMSAQVNTVLSEMTPENIFKRLQELRSNIDAGPAIKDERVDALVREVETLHARDSILAKALNDLGQLMRHA